MTLSIQQNSVLKEAFTVQPKHKMSHFAASKRPLLIEKEAMDLFPGTGLAFRGVVVASSALGYVALPYDYQNWILSSCSTGREESSSLLTVSDFASLAKAVFWILCLCKTQVGARKLLWPMTGPTIDEKAVKSMKFFADRTGHFCRRLSRHFHFLVLLPGLCS